MHDFPNKFLAVLVDTRFKLDGAHFQFHILFYLVNNFKVEEQKCSFIVDSIEKKYV